MDDVDPRMSIIAAAALEVRSRYHRAKGKSPRQIVFGQEMILPINYAADWRYISQRKQAQIDKDVICFKN